MNTETVKTIEDCTELAILDTYNEYEHASGWLCCIEDVFSKIKKVIVFGEEVDLVEFELCGLSIMAICRKDGVSNEVAFESVDLVNPSKIQKLWFKAWQSWSENL